MEVIFVGYLKVYEMFEHFWNVMSEARTFSYSASYSRAGGEFIDIRKNGKVGTNFSDY